MAQATQPRAHVPAVGRRILERPRLLKRLKESAARTILLVAPAGYGKTTLARQWLEVESGALFAVGLAGSDVAVLARSLGAALAESHPTVPRIVEEAIKAGPTSERQTKSLVHAILGELEEPVKRWLAIDDYHAVEPGSAADSLIESLEASGLFRLIVASRTRPSWASSRRFVYGDLMEIGQDELALDEEESAELLSGRADAHVLGRRARGWPALVGLAAVAGSGEAPPGAGSESLYDFFAEEVFGNAPAEAQDALLRIALLPALERERLVQIVGANSVDDVVRTGLVSEAAGRFEIHPLVREFLYEKIERRPDLAAAVEGGISFSIEHGYWDEAFELITRFRSNARLEELITESFLALVESGRVATLRSFGIHAAKTGGVPQALLDLIDAEIALRNGALERALYLGKAAASRMGDDHRLKSRSYVLAGAGANLDWKLEDAFELFTQAIAVARRPRDLTDASWRRCLTSLFFEDHRLREAADEFASIAGSDPEDRLRLVLVRLHLARLAADGFWDLRRESQLSDNLFPVVSDPLMRSGWGNTYGYSLMLQARYDLAKPVLVTALADVDRYALEFARPHIEWSLAATELGLRQFARADRWLRRVESQAGGAGSSYLEINCRALRARLLLAQRRASEAVAITAACFPEFPKNAMHGEYVATRAVALAIVGETTQALDATRNAMAFTRAVEARVLSAAAVAICQLDTDAGVSAAQEMVKIAIELGTWDGVICALRASPGLLTTLQSSHEHRDQLVDVLTRAHDNALAHSSGFGMRRKYSRADLLSRREVEVIDLLAQGLKTREIAAVLYISEATAKVHVRHILEKLNARTRAEAVARYAETSAGSAG